MRITVVGPSHPVTGGVVAHTADLVHRLRADGVQAVLTTWERPFPAVAHPAARSRTPGGRPAPSPPDVPPVADARALLRWDRPRGWAATGRRLAESSEVVVLVHVMAVQAPALRAVAAGVRSARPSTRVVVLAHNVMPHERHVADRHLVRPLVAGADAVLVHTGAHARLVRTLGAAEVLVADLPPHLPRTGLDASDHTRHRPPSRDPAELRVLFLGHVRGYKGVDVLLDAAATCPEVRLTVAGEQWGRAGRDLGRRLAADAALRRRVEVRAGYVPADEVGRLLVTHDVLALPYRSGSGSQNADLAFAHGLPVVASDLPTFAGRVHDGVDGLLVPSGDARALADALRGLMVPGRLRGLAAGVTPPDVQGAWQLYLEALYRAGSGTVRTPAPESLEPLRVSGRTTP